VPIAFIALDFDPVLRLADGVAIRWQIVALVAIVTAGLIVTGLIARRNGLRADDLLFIAVAVVPGAVIGGRVGYVLMHLDYYTANTTAIADPGQGSMELALAIVGGMLSGAYVASLLGAPIDRWLRTVALPLLFVLGAGKLAMVLGGVGQGQPTGLPWATAYLGAGPWGTLAPDVPSHPSQAYEGLVTLAILALLSIGLAVGAIDGRDGRLFLGAVAAWAVVRTAVSLTWRDDVAVAGLSVGGLIAAVVALGFVGVLALRWRGRLGSIERESRTRDVAWADPETRPRF
jgi:phosphatidylglycerol---prolipoprotein diacylglyceryl transferase